MAPTRKSDEIHPNGDRQAKLQNQSPANAQRPIQLPAEPELKDGLPYQLFRIRESFKMLGVGTFATVWSMVDPADKKKYAIKCIKMYWKNKVTLHKEVQILLSLNHPNVVKIYGAWPEYIHDTTQYQALTAGLRLLDSSDLVDPDQLLYRSPCSAPLTKRPKPSQNRKENLSEDGLSGPVLFIKMECCDPKHLQTKIDCWDVEFGHPKPENVVMETEDILGQLLDALSHLKEMGVIHKDIKPNNILFKDGVVKLADFGISSLQNEESGCSSGSLKDQQNKLKESNGSSNPKQLHNRCHDYQSNELAEKGNVSHKDDMYSVGCVIFRLLSNNSDDLKNLHDEKKRTAILERFKSNYVSHSKTASLVYRMLSLDPNIRPDTSDPVVLDLISRAKLEKVIVEHDYRSADLPSEEMRIIERNEWGARLPKQTLTDMVLPVKIVVISHSVWGEGHCTSDECCRILMREIQDLHMDRNKWDDIGYQFAVGGNGIVYESRGWKKTGAHTGGYNAVSIGICLLGDFDFHLPPRVQIESTKKLIELGVQNGSISPDYQLYGLRDLRPHFDSPGDYLYEDMKSWANKAQPLLL